MSKYDLIWKYVSECGKENLTLKFDEIEKISGVPLDHSFLQYKKELVGLGWEVVKISLKNQTVLFGKTLVLNNEL